MACAQSLATHFGLEVVERDANLLELGKPAAVLLPFNPPPMKLLPRHLPDCRVKGAIPANEAI